MNDDRYPPMRPPRNWYPLCAQRRYLRPDVGDIIGIDHGVWRVVDVRDVPVLPDDDREAWEQAGRPDPETWRLRPYAVRALHLGGKIDPGCREVDEPMFGGRGHYGTMRIPAGAFWAWHVYVGGRWPVCSCCGEPMPCRAEAEDRTVEYQIKVQSRHERKMPGCCWACNEPVTSRQESVVYAGMNLDLPTAPPPQFHTRRRCHDAAVAYEDRWRAEDVSRPRILTWPKCRGRLVTHTDGSSECHGGEGGCRGHETHDHRSLMSCKAQSHGCPRVECAASEIRWIVLPKRKRRDVRAAP